MLVIKNAKEMKHNHSVEMVAVLQFVILQIGQILILITLVVEKIAQNANLQYIDQEHMVAPNLF